MSEDGTDRETMAVVTERGTPVAVFESADEAEEWAINEGLVEACLIYPSVRKRETGGEQ